METKNFQIVRATSRQYIDPKYWDELKKHACDSHFCDGIQEFEYDEAQVDEFLGERAYSGGDLPESVLDEVSDLADKNENRTLDFYFYEGENSLNAENFKQYLDSLDSYESVQIEKVVEDYNAEWKKHYSSIEVTPDFWVVPEWAEEVRIGTRIRIRPGMGFGTGGHETTFLCLKILKKIHTKNKKVKKVLDFGCGSGILGIGAMKLQGSLVDFVDIDSNALENCYHNILLNFEESELLEMAQKNGNENWLVTRKKYEARTDYDLVFANILLNALVEEKAAIISNLKVGGDLILSGVLYHQVDELLQEYSKHNLNLVDILKKGDWAAIHLKKQQ